MLGRQESLEDIYFPEEICSEEKVVTAEDALNQIAVDASADLLVTVAVHSDS